MSPTFDPSAPYTGTLNEFLAEPPSGLVEWLAPRMDHVKNHTGESGYDWFSDKFADSNAASAMNDDRFREFLRTVTRPYAESLIDGFGADETAELDKTLRRFEAKAMRATHKDAWNDETVASAVANYTHLLRRELVGFDRAEIDAKAKDTADRTAKRAAARKSQAAADQALATERALPVGKDARISAASEPEMRKVWALYAHRDKLPHEGSALQLKDGTLAMRVDKDNPPVAVGDTAYSYTITRRKWSYAPRVVTAVHSGIRDGERHDVLETRSLTREELAAYKEEQALLDRDW